MTRTSAKAAARRPARPARDDDLELRPLLGLVEVAQILDLPKATLYRWHSLSNAEVVYGPRAFLVGRHLRYTLGDVRDYIENLGSSAS